MNDIDLIKPLRLRGVLEDVDANGDADDEDGAGVEKSEGD